MLNSKSVIDLANYVVKANYEFGKRSRFVPSEMIPVNRVFSDLQLAAINVRLKNICSESNRDKVVLQWAAAYAGGMKESQIAKKFGLKGTSKLRFIRPIYRRLYGDDQFWLLVENSEEELQIKMQETAAEMDNLYEAYPAIERWLELRELYSAYGEIPYPESYSDDPSLTDLDLSVRTLNVIQRRSGCWTVKELLKIEPDRFWNLEQLGEKGGQEIIDAINKLGFAFNPPRPSKKATR